MQNLKLDICVGCTEEYKHLLGSMLDSLPDWVGICMAVPYLDEAVVAPDRTRSIQLDEPFSRGPWLNAAASIATAPTIMLADADFVFLPGYFELLRYYMESMRRTRTYLNSYVYMTAEGEDESVLDDPEDLPCYTIGRGHVLPTQNPLIIGRRTFIDDLGGYDERIRGWGGEDDDLDHRMQRFGLTRVRLPLLVVHRYHGEISSAPEYKDDDRHTRNVEIIKENDDNGIIKAN